MANTIDEYREAKATFLKLRDQAKKDLLAEFHQLAAQLLEVQRELREDFGHKIAIPTKAKHKRPKKSSGKTAAPAPKTIDNHKIAAIEKKIAAQKKKLDETSKAGRPVQGIKDKLYELEDELRLSREG